MQSVGQGGGNTVIHAPIVVNVEGGSQGPQADQELAKRIGREVQTAVDAAVGRNLRQHLRSSNMLNPMMNV